MDSLRSRTIRLAFTSPELRAALLPLLTRTAAEEPDVDPKTILEALSEVTKNPDEYGVEDTDTLDKLKAHVESLLDGAPEPEGKTASALANGLKLAAAGVKVINAAMKATRHIAEKVPKAKGLYDKALSNTLGIAYAAVCIGTAATLSAIAPDHPIAKHAAEYDTMATQASEHLPLLEKLRQKTLAVVEATSDDDVKTSVAMMEKAASAVKKSMGVSDETIKASIEVHRSLQELFGHFIGKEVKHTDPKGDGGSSTRTYKEYAEEKAKSGERPMPKDEWESRYGK